MRLTPQILDEIRARLPVSQIVAKRVDLKRAGREFKGLSPFKQEKTPSFTVNDQKGFYHCFATGEHGDIFTFLIKTEGLSFPEAVERLAQEAGVSLPRNEPYDRAREDARTRLLKLMQLAAEYFHKLLHSESGNQAREYLNNRQLERETIDVFQLGYASPRRNALKDHLASSGFSEAEMVQSGMLIGGPDIATPYDRFRHRIIYPIHDHKGRVVAFGGRALDPSQPAKYLNSPETPLFHKGTLLYNAHRARSPAYEQEEVIAVEGYMDAIALSQAGFPHCVAPLGTALTVEQVQLLWRMSPEPILCFDGDAAGRKAAHRAMDTAIPLLKAGFSLRFAFLAEGLDPDDLLRQRGPEALRSLLDGARPLAEVLWEREWQAGTWSTPERRANLEHRLRKLVHKIEDPGVRNHYGQALRERLQKAWGTDTATTARQIKNERGSTGNRSFEPINGKARRQRRRYDTSSFPTERTSSLKQSALVAGQGQTIPYREALLVRTLLNHGWIVDDYAEDIAQLKFSSTSLIRLCEALLTLQASEIDLDSSTIRNQLERLGLSQDVNLVDRITTHRSDRFAEPDAERAEVEVGWRHALAMHNRQMLQEQLADTVREYDTTNDDDVMDRIVELQRLIAISTANEVQLED